MRPLVEATLDALNIAYPGPSSDEVQIAATRVMCKRLLQGSLTARDFDTWAHSTIGHEGAAQLQHIVELDDAYDVSEYTGDALEDLEVAAHQEARSLLAGEPLPARAAPSQPGEMAASASTESRFGSAWRRAPEPPAPLTTLGHAADRESAVVPMGGCSFIRVRLR